jgi:hypothetical protein
MRAVLLILILAVIVLLAAVATGFVDINQVRGVSAPNVSASTNGVTAKGGQAPAFDVQTGSVQIGTRNATVTVPEMKVVPPANKVEQNTANAQ